MGAAEPREGAEGESPAVTLGDVLYAKPGPRVAEADWARLVRAVAAGNQPALHMLYERAHRPVFTLAMRITGNRETAEELTVDVFHYVWRTASRYDPAQGTVLGWIMNLARSRAIDRLRFEQRKKRNGGQESADLETADDCDDVVARREQGIALRTALAALAPEERKAIETAFFNELTYGEVAARLNEPLGTIKTRIRTGLHKLRSVLSAGAEER
ncbi:MAG TPA: sigma-70 family RNA polymerase sigma factor [Burkholderiales bacterium]|nr:sigma-70 family RNA polymerase sigma factor [Burkholderiales bacterium]